MELTTEQSGDLTCVTLRGDHLDAGVAEEFKRDMAPLLKGDARLLLDMTRLRFLDSAGIGALLSCLRQVSAGGGDMKLFGLTKNVRAVFEMTRMHRLFDLYETREEAVAAFGEQNG